MREVEEVLSRITIADPLLQRISEVSGATSFRIADLCTSELLDACRAGAKRRWEIDDDRVATRLWWFSASYLLVGSAVLTWLAGSAAIVASPNDRLWLGEFHYLDRFEATQAVRYEDLPQTLNHLIAPIVDSLTSLGSERAPVLWAIAGDMPTLAAEIAVIAGMDAQRVWQKVFQLNLDWGKLSPVPPMQLIDVSAGNVREISADSLVCATEHRTGLRRACCLLVKVPDCSCCQDCPRQERFRTRQRT